MWGFLEHYLARLLDRHIVAVWAAASAIMAVAGPFGTYHTMGPVLRAAYWSGIIALSLVIALGIRPAVRRHWPHENLWVETFRVSLLFTAIYTPMLLVVTWRVAGPGSSEVLDPVEMAAVVFLVPFAATALRQIFGADDMPARDPDSGPRLLRRLDDGAALVRRVSGRDHYVDVYTDRGKATLLMRFSDAVAELEGAPGLQVHRSHWVSADVVDRVETEGNRMFLRLNCGNRVPVSRGYRPSVEASELFASLMAQGAGTTRTGSPTSAARARE